MMNTEELKKIALAVGICYGAYRFIQHPALKAGALAVGAVIVAKRVPYISTALA